MKFYQKKIKNVYEIILNPIIDDRGFFMRTYDEKIFKENGLMVIRGNGEKSLWVQENHSKSLQKGIIRGLHFQLPPYTETKLIRCIRGKVQDVFVDLRKDSETFGKWDSLILSEDNFKCVLVPRGFAHGFCTLTDDCEVAYKVDNYYTPQYEGGLLWNDPDINIKWMVDNPILSEKDKKNPTFREFVNKYKGI